ncbi:histidine kinase [Halorarum salinum]|uniref:Histidine kinase n=1 Tax=Halorarum salinum TaxID=2743089 RepID=A0A7D5QBM1_9EURY|nr:histidine kinase [Halobaculum salinum]QLG63217.1 histidine kinase [Halobaculum salinum]
MASETVTDVERRGITGHGWVSAALAGIVGGIAFGAMMQLMMPDVLEMAIPSLYGLGPGLAVGWLVHLFHSAAFGLVYAAIVRLDALAAYANRVTTGAGLGVAYGVLVWLFAASVVMPLWVGAVLPMNPPVPDFNPASLVGHAVFGVLLGALYPLLAARV